MPVQPPDDPGESPEDAWRNGFEAACHLVRARVSELGQSVATEDSEEDSDTTCGNCGGETIEVLGGRRCQDCGEVV